MPGKKQHASFDDRQTGDQASNYDPSFNAEEYFEIDEDPTRPEAEPFLEGAGTPGLGGHGGEGAEGGQR